MTDTIIDEQRWNEAQRHEIAFWQAVREKGYGGAPYPMWRQVYPLTEMWNYTVGCGYTLDYFHDKVVVEVGTGPLGIVAALEAREKVGLDPLSDAYDRLFDRPGDVRYMTSKGEDIPLADHYADVIYCKNVLDHVHNPPRLLQEVRRTLKPGGVFILIVNLAGHDAEAPKDDPLHPYSFTAEGVRAMVSAAGFVVEKAHGGGEWQAVGSFRPTWFMGVLRA
jgi:SAM-dependent methyltransferase